MAQATVRALLGGGASAAASALAGRGSASVLARRGSTMNSTAVAYCISSKNLPAYLRLGAPFSSTSGSGGTNEMVDQLERMMEVMLSTPGMQDMLLAKLPPHMRRPEVLRAMLANPEVRTRMADLMQHSGLSSQLLGLDPRRMAEGMAASRAAGLDPAALLAAFHASPSLAPRMSNPRVLTALMDLASNGPDAMKKYSGDKEVVEAAMEAGDIIAHMQQQASANGSGGSSSSSSSESASTSSSEASSTGGAASSSSTASQLLGIKPEELMQRLMARPDIMARVQNPKVLAALQDVSAAPWRIVKYLLNREVMDALKELKALLQQQQQPPPPSSHT